MTPSAVALDFDGVIVESVTIKNDAFKELFNEHAEHRAQIGRFLDAHAGLDRFSKFARIHSEILQKPLDEAGARKLDVTFSAIVENRVNHAPFVPGALEFLHQHQALGLHLISATPSAELKRIVEWRRLTSFFQTIHGSPAGKAAVLSEIIEARSSPPHQVIFVGDTRFDEEAAAQAGASFIGRVVNRADDPFGADVIRVSSLADLSSRWSETLQRLQPSAH